MRIDIEKVLIKVMLAALCMALIVGCTCAIAMMAFFTGKCLIAGAC